MLKVTAWVEIPEAECERYVEKLVAAAKQAELIDIDVVKLTSSDVRMLPYERGREEQIKIRDEEDHGGG